MNICITGSLGFIGYNIITNLLKRKNVYIYAIDNFDETLYSIEEKKTRLKNLRKYKNFKFLNINISNIKKLKLFFSSRKIRYIINLAGQAGVRNSLIEYKKFVDDNILGFSNIIYLSKLYKIKLIYASTSAIYCDRVNKRPHSIKENVYQPQSIYGVSKLHNELTAEIFFREFGFKSFGLRFFTVYGDSSRSDMAIYKFIDSIFKGKKIKLFNYGKYYRDFVHVSSISFCINRIIFENKFDHKILNIGATQSYKLIDVIKMLEDIIGKKAKVDLVPPIMNEPLITQADMKDTFKFFGRFEQKPLKDGLISTVDWYKKNKF